MPVIALDDVWKFFGNFPALRQVGLNLEPGWCCALLGRNGAGKTTLLRVLAGLQPVSARQHLGAGVEGPQ